MPDNRFFTVTLDIPADQYAQYYTGGVRQVVVQTADGIVVRFPANILQKFVTHTGIKGTFSIQVDDANKLISIEKL